jgi:hypothetical protein
MDGGGIAPVDFVTGQLVGGETRSHQRSTVYASSRIVMGVCENDSAPIRLSGTAEVQAAIVKTTGGTIIRRQRDPSPGAQCTNLILPVKRAC